MNNQIPIVKRTLLNTVESAPLTDAWAQPHEAMASRLKALTRRVAVLERYATQGRELSPALVAVLSYLNVQLEKIEEVFPTQKRVGRPKTPDEALRILLALVEATKREDIKSDKAAIEQIISQTGFKGTEAKEKVKTLQNQLIIARKLFK